MELCKDETGCYWQYATTGGMRRDYMPTELYEQVLKWGEATFSAHQSFASDGVTAKVGNVELDFHKHTGTIKVDGQVIREVTRVVIEVDARSGCRVSLELIPRVKRD